MSVAYDNYLEQHKTNVRKGYEWLKEFLPKIVEEFGVWEEGFLEWLINFNHDSTKTTPMEYAAYDAYFYGGNKSHQVVQDFNKAWLHHIHCNEHHWQHWVLINDDPKEGVKILDMPDHYIVEMICDWWAFSWAAGDLFTIFKWYDEHKEYIQLSIKTRQKVERLLFQIREKLEENNNGKM